MEAKRNKSMITNNYGDAVIDSITISQVLGGMRRN
jgi:hypothetical protein